MADGATTGTNDFGRSRDHRDTSEPTSYLQRAAMVIALALGMIVLLLTLWYTVDVWLLAFAGVLLAVLLRAMANAVSRVTRLSTGWSLAVVSILLVGVTALSSWLLTPRIAVQVEQLRQTLPTAIDQLAEYIQQFQWGQILAEQLRALGDAGDLREAVPALAAGAATALGAASAAIVGSVVALFIGIFLAINPGIYVRGVIRMVPQSGRPRAVQILEATETSLRWWLIGRIIAMTFVGVTTAIGLWLLDVPLALSLGVVAGVLDFIPNIGPILAAVPAIIIAFAESPQTALYVLILYFVVQQLESYIVTPIVQQKAVSLPPAFTVFIQLLFVVLAGPLGLLLATPLAAAGLVIVRGLYVQDALGDKEVKLID